MSRVDIDENHIKWLEELITSDAYDKLNEWEKGFVSDIALKIEMGDLTTLSENQDAKLRQIAFENLVS